MRALETSADVEFSVDVIQGEQTPQVRAETTDYLISFGVSGSVADSIQASTTQLVNWLKKDYVSSTRTTTSSPRCRKPHSRVSGKDKAPRSATSKGSSV